MYSLFFYVILACENYSSRICTSDFSIINCSICKLDKLSINLRDFILQLNEMGSRYQGDSTIYAESELLWILDGNQQEDQCLCRHSRPENSNRVSKSMAKSLGRYVKEPCQAGGVSIWSFEYEDSLDESVGFRGSLRSVSDSFRYSESFSVEEWRHFDSGALRSVPRGTNGAEAIRTALSSEKLDPTLIAIRLQDNAFLASRSGRQDDRCLEFAAGFGDSSLSSVTSVFDSLYLSDVDDELVRVSSFESSRSARWFYGVDTSFNSVVRDDIACPRDISVPVKVVDEGVTLNKLSSLLTIFGLIRVSKKFALNRSNSENQLTAKRYDHGTRSNHLRRDPGLL